MFTYKNKKKNFNTHLHTTSKIYSKKIIDLNVREKILKHLEGNIGEKFYYC